MARRFNKISEWEVYVPDVGNERSVFAHTPEDAFTVEVRWLTARKAREFERLESPANDAQTVSEALQEAARQLFIQNVRGVKNYAPNGIELTTGEEVWEHGEPDVINDIAAAVRNRAYLDAGLGKVLGSRSSSSQTLQPGCVNGDVVGATRAEDQTTQATTIQSQTEDCRTPRKGVHAIATGEELRLGGNGLQV